MQDNFLNALEHVLAHEGGWADHPRDPGGATMKGVTLAVYQRYFGADKDKAALRAISDAELQHVYRTGYWEKCRCDELPNGVDYAVFDAAVNLRRCVIIGSLFCMASRPGMCLAKAGRAGWRVCAAPHWSWLRVASWWHKHPLLIIKSFNGAHAANG
ncbi:Glycosyl hydrolase 108 [Nitrosomonas halophila]|uniref:Glycosyl hydrolase 108 n=1 Tax=Nitrosomonas halophila TaxID=44576 RepID=A0A1H3MN55_9PROT|nr:Glycosyl hydrolase 108 [Nitrosomonas halophila]